MQLFFPAIVEVDEADGGFGAEIVGTGVLGQGETVVEALSDAGAVLQEVIWAAVAEGAEVPGPGAPSDEDLARGQVALVQATLPSTAAA
jgi:predicted RNase H-like HicB family nuclease